jgi:hypothetical protein
MVLFATAMGRYAAARQIERFDRGPFPPLRMRNLRGPLAGSSQWRSLRPKHRGSWCWHKAFGLKATRRGHVVWLTGHSKLSDNWLRCTAAGSFPPE